MQAIIIAVMRVLARQVCYQLCLADCGWSLLNFLSTACHDIMHMHATHYM